MAQWYICFSSVWSQTWVKAQSLGEYCNFSTVRLFMHVLWKTGTVFGGILQFLNSQIIYACLMKDGYSLWGNIAISQQSDYLCMSYERQVFILMCLIVNVRGSLHDTRNEIRSKWFSFGHAKRFSFILLFIAEEMKHLFRGSWSELDH